MPHFAALSKESNMLWELHTNEGTRFVRLSYSALQSRMTEYIKAKRLAGMRFSDITFCYRPIYLGALR